MCQLVGDFAPVSIKMAKDQNLSLNPTKISGICGRLMCCLRYEHENYVQIRKELPRRNDRVMTPEGKAVVIDPVILKESVKVRVIVDEEKNELGEDILIFHKDEIGPIPKCDKKGNCPKHKEKPAQDDVDYKDSELVAEAEPSKEEIKELEAMLEDDKRRGIAGGSKGKDRPDRKARHDRSRHPKNRKPRPPKSSRSNDGKPDSKGDDKSDNSKKGDRRPPRPKHKRPEKNKQDKPQGGNE